MVLSDMVQGVRRIRALLTTEDLQMLAADHVAGHANVDLTSPDVHMHTLVINPNPAPGSHAAEVIIEVRQS